MSQVAGPSTIALPDRSRTIVVHDSQPRQDEGPGPRIEGVLQVRATARSRTRTQDRPRVTWTEDVVDNEGMGKKKSKLCCIFHKQRRYDESSSSSDSDSESSDSDSASDSGADSGAARPGGRLRGRGRNGRHPHQHNHNHSHSHSHDQNGANGGGQVTRDGGGSTTVHELSDDGYEPNAYERQPGKGNGRGKGKGKRVDKDKDQSHPQPQ